MLNHHLSKRLSWWGRVYVDDENVDADISNIHIRIIQLSLLGIHIHIMRLLFTSAQLLQLLNAVIIRYLRVRQWTFWIAI